MVIDKKKILIIEDTLTYQQGLKREFIKQGYEVKCASSGEEGLHEVKSFKPNLIVLDLLLPGMGGREVCRELKMDIKYRHLPIMMLTMIGEDKTIEESLESGADSYVSKNESMDLIVKRAEALLKLSGIIEPLLDEHEGEEEEEEEERLSGKTILLVDDDITFLQGIKRQLMETGYKVVTAMSGEECFERLKEHVPDIILLDLVMPGIDGADVCRQIRKIKKFHNLPIVMLTASESNEDINRSFEAGVNDYVIKSADLKVINLRVYSILRRKHYEEETRQIRYRLSNAEMKNIIANAEKEAEKRHAAELAAALEDSETARKAVQNLMNDVQAANDQMRKLTRAVEQSPATIMITDMSGKIEYVNPKFTEVTGYTPQEAIGQTPRILQSGHHPLAFYQELWGTVITAHEWRGELCNKKKNGELFWEYTSISPVKDANDKISHFIAVSEDMTERKQAEEIQKKLTLELTRSNKDLEHFAYIASHDLQEPLRKVSNFMALLAERYQDKLDQDAREFIDYAVDGARRMKVMIDDLLIYSRVGTQGKAFTSVDMMSVMQNVLNDSELSIQENNAVITYDSLPMITADDTQMQQLFRNLIGNALKYRGEDPPKIHISAERREQAWYFCVKDNGIGIEERFFKRIFQIFQRLHPRDRYAGTGIGLSVCKKIVERHSGIIGVESSPGQGSTFYFTIPEIKEDI
jgi:PAS domain S-box-containing protein